MIDSVLARVEGLLGFHTQTLIRIDPADVRLLVAELHRLQGDNALLRQKLGLAWRDVNAPESSPS